MTRRLLEPTLTMEEHRSYSRVRSRLVAFLTLPETGRVVRALTENISGAGIRFTSDELLQPGTSLQAEVQLPDGGAPIKVTIQVVWSRVLKGSRSGRVVRAEVGVRFLEIAPKDRAMIVHYARLNALDG